MTEVDRAIAAGRTDGFIKLVAGPRLLTRDLGGGKLLGATIVAERAGEMIHEVALAMRTGHSPGGWPRPCTRTRPGRPGCARRRRSSSPRSTGALRARHDERTSMGLLSRARELERVTRLGDPDFRAALAARWAGLPDVVKTPGQVLGRHAVGCEGTHGVFPRCNLACTPCYHSRDANRVRVDGDHTVSQVARPDGAAAQAARPARPRPADRRRGQPAAAGRPRRDAAGDARPRPRANEHDPRRLRLRLPRGARARPQRARRASSGCRSLRTSTCSCSAAAGSSDRTTSAALAPLPPPVRADVRPAAHASTACGRSWRTT